MDLTLQIETTNQKVTEETVQYSKGCESQSLLTYAKRGEEVATMSAAIKKDLRKWEINLYIDLQKKKQKNYK